jgi:hypothetical protein
VDHHVPKEFFSMPYNSTNDSAHTAQDDATLRQNVLKDIDPHSSPPLSSEEKQFVQRIENFNPAEMRLFAAIREKNGPEIKSALANMDPAKLDSQLENVLRTFNDPAIGTTIETTFADKEGARQLDLSWKTSAKHKVVLYSGEVLPKD